VTDTSSPWAVALSWQHITDIPSILGQTDLHCVSKKLCHYTCVHNSGKCWPIFTILSLWNLQQNSCQHVPPHLKNFENWSTFVDIM